MCIRDRCAPAPYVIDASTELIDRIAQNDMVRGVTIAAGGFFGPQGRELRAVSYTHLDVYKRQPIDDSLAVNQELQAVLQVTDLGMATSGNYRNY